MALQTFRLDTALDAGLASQITAALQGIGGIHRVLANEGDAYFAVDMDEDARTHEALTKGLVKAGFEVGEDPRSEGTCCGGCCGSK